MCLETAKPPIRFNSECQSEHVPPRVRGGGGCGLTLPSVFRAPIVVSVSSSVSGSYHGRSGQLISCHRCLTYPRGFLAPLPALDLVYAGHYTLLDQIQLLSGTTSAETHAYHYPQYGASKVISTYKHHPGHSSENEAHPIRYLLADNSFKPQALSGVRCTT